MLEKSLQCLWDCPVAGELILQIITVQHNTKGSDPFFLEIQHRGESLQVLVLKGIH